MRYKNQIPHHGMLGYISINLSLTRDKMRWFDICVVGASSGLGKEIIYQSLQNNKKVLGLTNNPEKVCIPYRGGGLTQLDTSKIQISNSDLIIDSYENSKKYR